MQISSFYKMDFCINGGSIPFLGKNITNLLFKCLVQNASARFLENIIFKEKNISTNY